MLCSIYPFDLRQLNDAESKPVSAINGAVGDNAQRRSVDPALEGEWCRGMRGKNMWVKCKGAV